MYRLWVLLVCLLTAVSLRGQSAPSAHEGSLPLMVGGGVSNFNLDFGAGRRMTGVTLWGDWDLAGHRLVPHGLSLELQGRSIHWGLPQGFSLMEQNTYLGGARYSWEHYRNVHPYAKCLAGIGSIDFPPYPNGYSHDTRDVLAPGGGLEVRASKQVWVRADYEYQFWRHIFGVHDLNPNGFTLGVEYSFKHIVVFK
ncbi:outer membrane beta-barrel protein [Telmatobacter bradus]|uniref:outer membrane beta-barrel protein n=1 Tax=Telmatobacter bradus TaxID=474953 RepID=UPI003B42DEEA